MREIKFRAKEKETGRWIYADRFGDVIGIVEPIVLGREIKAQFDISEETTGQYTGLKDKNWVEIYEGDIIHWDWEKIPYLVYWSDNTCQFTTDMRWLWSSIENVEVIGNIHDNPELLEVGE